MSPIAHIEGRVGDGSVSGMSRTANEYHEVQYPLIVLICEQKADIPPLSAWASDKEIAERLAFVRMLFCSAIPSRGVGDVH